MGKYLGRVLLSCLFGIWLSPFAISATLPEGTVIKVRSFTFPKAAYTGSNEESDRLSGEFYSQLVLALEQAGLQIDTSSDQRADQTESPESALSGSDEVRQPASVQDDEAVLTEQKDEIEQTVKSNTAENDQLMQLVEAVEKEEKAKQKGQTDPTQKRQSGPYVITGSITQYEELVGVPVSTGSSRRSRVEVSLLGSYKVVDPAGKTIVLEKLSASASRVVPETMDIYEVLQSLIQFFLTTHSFQIS